MCDPEDDCPCTVSFDADVNLTVEMDTEAHLESHLSTWRQVRQQWLDFYRFVRRNKVPVFPTNLEDAPRLLVEEGHCPAPAADVKCHVCGVAGHKVSKVRDREMFNTLRLHMHPDVLANASTDKPDPQPWVVLIHDGCGKRPGADRRLLTDEELGDQNLYELNAAEWQAVADAGLAAKAFCTKNAIFRHLVALDAETGDAVIKKVYADAKRRRTEALTTQEEEVVPPLTWWVSWLKRQHRCATAECPHTVDNLPLGAFRADHDDLSMKAFDVYFACLGGQWCVRGWPGLVRNAAAEAKKCSMYCDTCHVRRAWAQLPAAHIRND